MSDEKSFTDNIEQLDLTEFAPGDTDADVDAAFNGLLVKGTPADEGIDPVDLTMLDEAPDNYIGDGKYLFDESPAKQPPETTQRARLDDSEFYWYQKGAAHILDKLREIVDLSDEDGLAIGFCQLMPADRHVGDVQAWADDEGLRAALSTEPLEVPIFVGADGIADVDVKVLLTYDTHQLAVMISDLYAETQHQAKAIREHASQLETIEQAINRDNYGAELWADLADFFNEHFTGTAFDDTGMPLLDRIKKYVSQQHSDTEKLHPALAARLDGEPENGMNLTQVAKLNLMISRLQKSDATLKSELLERQMIQHFFNEFDEEMKGTGLNSQVEAFYEVFRNLKEDAARYRDLIQ